MKILQLQTASVLDVVVLRSDLEGSASSLDGDGSVRKRTHSDLRRSVEDLTLPRNLLLTNLVAHLRLVARQAAAGGHAVEATVALDLVALTDIPVR